MVIRRTFSPFSAFVFRARRAICPITYFNCFGVQAGMHEPQGVLDIQCEWGCGAHRNRTLPWDIALLLQCLLVLEAIPVRAVGAHLRPIHRGFASPGGTTAKATWLRFSTVACIHHGVTFSNVLCHVVQHYAQGHCHITKEATLYTICKPQVASLHSIVWLCYDHEAVLGGRFRTARAQRQLLLLLSR